MNSLDINQFEAVLFDLDSTLLDTHRYPMVASEWLLQKSGVTSEEEVSSFIRTLVSRYRSAIQAIVEGAPYRSPYDIIRVAIGESLHDIEVDVDHSLIEETTSRFKSLHVELSTPNDGVEDLLRTLQARDRKLGVITNSFEGNARIILKKLELNHYFSSIIDCGDVQSYKPMSSPFVRVARDLDVEISKAIYVGDEYYADMVGAKGIGMATIWINKWDRSFEDLIAKHGVASSPDYILNSVSEICKLL